jgi:hypothetical protein
MFQESCNSLSIQLSKANLELKMAANSTYWEAKLRSDGLWHIATGENWVFISFLYQFSIASLTPSPAIMNPR